MNAKLTVIVILGRSVLKEIAFVEETAPETGDTAEVIAMIIQIVYTTVKEFENGGFTLRKTYQMFSICTTSNKR